MTALVFNCHYNGLGIIQELGTRGVKVLALDNARSVGTYSRYAKFYRCPDPIVAEGAFIQYLLNLGPKFREKPVLFPTNDHWATAISRYKNELSQFYVPCVADWPTVETIILKRRFYVWAAERGYPVPKCWTKAELHTIPNVAFPIVAKPEYRRISSDVDATSHIAQKMDRLRLALLEDRGQLDEFLLNHQDVLDYLLFTEYVAGLSDRMYTIGIYANREFEVLGMFSGRKVRGFPPDIGDCMVGQIERVPKRLQDLVKKICREINYHGIAEFEFKRDAITDEFKLIEINPRSWSWVGITPACGVSLPWIAYADLSGIETVSYAESHLSTGSVKWVRILEDLPNCLAKNRRAGYPEWAMTLGQWCKSLKSDRLVIAEFSIKDPLPGIYSLYARIRKLLQK